MLQIKPILAALKHHRVATFLIATQIALSMAVLCNAVFVMQLRLAHMARRPGIDAANLAVIHYRWIEKHTTQEGGALIATDLSMLRRLPGVTDAYADYTVPAAGQEVELLLLGLRHDQHAPTSLAEDYHADTHTMSTLGLKLVAGRNFRADEIEDIGDMQPYHPPSIIMTRALARKLFPGESPVGKTVQVNNHPSTIIGIIRHLQVPSMNANRIADFSVLVPSRLVSRQGNYLVRARPGQVADVMALARKALLAKDRMRVVSVKRYSDMLAKAYGRDRGVAILMMAICFVLVAATVGGIVGLANFWVGQRRRQIGIRRAVGATRGDILRYFQLENFLIVSLGIMLGILFSLALNAALMHHYELPRMPIWYLPLGTCFLWILGQIAVLPSALRAASVPPVVATRTV
ncbi:ABC transporter permease [Oleiagrimonas citrea]|uniref:FtsX-like permease family protein n=1 Tax=Oleiagrimonas citrea TaxID=1665687 RepID=A0A846ZQW6_9GAMM|nr:ABC transporter permease [Oleiagrimonas citrea]NKZ39803.1 FtsX-like permease family protein [Oleiagrimonas citrea]